MAVLFLSNPARGAVFAQSFADALPEVPFHIGTAPDPLAVKYLVTWTVPDLSTYPNLQMIFSVGAGVDQFDLLALPPSVRVVRMLEPGIACQMQEMAVMAALSLHRELPAYLDQGRQGLWRARQNQSAGHRRIGVMGMGNLGQAVVAALRPFGFPLAGWSRSARHVPGVDCMTDLNAFLSRTDILISLLPLTPQTRGLLNKGLFAMLPRGAHLVHLARGPQLDMAALRDALEDGQLSSAWLDVTDPEPLPPGHWAWSDPRVIITPHVSSQTDALDGARHVIAGIRADRAGQPVPGLVDRDWGY